MRKLKKTQLNVNTYKLLATTEEINYQYDDTNDDSRATCDDDVDDDLRVHEICIRWLIRYYSDTIASG